MYLTPDEKSLIIANALSDSLTFIDPKSPQKCNAPCAAFWTPTSCAFRPT